MARPLKVTAAQRREAELKTGERKPGRQRVYVRDTLSKTKRGKNAIKKMRDLRVKALRAHSVDGNSIKAIEQNNADRNLSEKQLMFARYWAQGETPRTSAVLAGYSESSSNIAWKLTRDPAILKLYQEEKRLYEEAAQTTRKRVMDMFQEAYDCAKLVSEPATMVAAAREMGKMCGYYEERVKIDVTVGGKLMDRLATLSDEQLLEIINKNPDAIPGVFSRVMDESEVPALEAPK